MGSAGSSGANLKDHLREILLSPYFANAPKHSAFLRFIVSAKLNGEEAGIKEAVIAAEVYGRPDYDPSLDSLVRMEAARLRAKLDKYYAERPSPVRIVLPKGSYVPKIEDAPVPLVSRRWRLILTRVLIVMLAAAAVVSAYLFRRHSRVENLIAEAMKQLPQEADFTVTSKPERTPQSLERLMAASALLEQALAIDPGNARALHGLASTYHKAADYDPRLYARMESASRKLLEVNPQSAPAHFYLGYHAFFERRDSRQAHAFFHRAVQLDPGDESLYRYAYLASTALERLEEAEKLLARGRKMLPESSVVALAYIASLGNLERFDEMEDEASALIRKKPLLHLAHLYLAQAHRHLGRHAEAEQEYLHCLKLSPGEGGCLANLAYLYHRTGRSGLALPLEAEIRNRHADNGHVLLAIASMGKPDPEAALEHLENGHRAHDLSMPYIRATLAFKPLRGDPRFLRLANHPISH